jgi:hypothetical protein
MAETFEDRLNRVLEETKIAPKLSLPTVKSKNDPSGVLLLFVLFLGLAAFVAFNYRAKMPRIPQLPNFTQYQQQQPNPTEELLAHVLEREKWNSDRLAMLGIAFNNNFAVYHNNFPKQDLVYLNKDWTVNSVPKHVQLTPRDINFIEGFINPPKPR